MDLKQFIIAHAAKQQAHKKTMRPESETELNFDMDEPALDEQSEMDIPEEAAPEESPVAAIIRRLRKGPR